MTIEPIPKLYSAHKGSDRKYIMANAMDLSKECCLCLQSFNDPRLLPCLHTFCSKCLENYMGKIIPNDWHFCPVCGSKFIVPEEGLAGLPKNIWADKSTAVTSTFKSAENASCDACSKVGLGAAEKYCINCEKLLCLKCLEEHEKEYQHLIVDLDSFEAAKTVEGVEVCRCRVHPEEISKLFCTFCKKVICNKCFHESHSSHCCSNVTDVMESVSSPAEAEYKNAEKMQKEFQNKKEVLHGEQMKFLEKVKKMETEILKRCEEIKELVVKETKALLQELDVLKTERLEEIGMEQKRMDKHMFTLEKFKEHCAWIKSNRVHVYTCEAECILRKTADKLRRHQKSRCEIRILPLQIEFQKGEIREFVMPISNSIGKINVICEYDIKLSRTIDTSERTIHGMTSIQDKLYLLSDSILIHQAEKPYNCVGEIKIPCIKTPNRIVPCCKTSQLYIDDSENECIWKVSIPDQQVTLWFDKTKESCLMSVTPDGKILMKTQSADAKQSVNRNRNLQTSKVTFELYNQNAILTERIELLNDIQPLEHIIKTQSGNYIGFGNKTVYKFRADGAIVCRYDIATCNEIGKYIQGVEMSSYQVFLIWRDLDWNIQISVLTPDLSFQRYLPGMRERNVTSMCYVKATKELAVVEREKEQFVI